MGSTAMKLVWEMEGQQLCVMELQPINILNTSHEISETHNSEWMLSVRRKSCSWPSACVAEYRGRRPWGPLQQRGFLTLCTLSLNKAQSTTLLTQESTELWHFCVGCFLSVLTGWVCGRLRSLCLVTRTVTVLKSSHVHVYILYKWHLYMNLPNVHCQCEQEFLHCSMEWGLELK